MSRLLKKSGIMLSTLFSVVVLALAADAAMAQGNSEHSHGRNKNIGHNNASDGVMGRVRTNHSIFYTGDPLEIGIQFPRGAELIASGEVDAWLLIFSPDAETIKVPVSSVASEDDYKLFGLEAVDIQALPEGVYQLGLVITVPEGDPLNIEDWYNGLLGLVTVRGITVSAMPLEEDVDGDGELDNDDDGDGFVGDDEEEEIDHKEVSDDNSSDECTADTESDSEECVADDDDSDECTADTESDSEECVADDDSDDCSADAESDSEACVADDDTSDDTTTDEETTDDTTTDEEAV